MVISDDDMLVVSDVICQTFVWLWCQICVMTDILVMSDLLVSDVVWWMVLITIVVMLTAVDSIGDHQLGRVGDVSLS